jgi:uncharacterized protein YcsI (UPF0317 family)
MVPTSVVTDCCAHEIEPNIIIVVIAKHRTNGCFIVSFHIKEWGTFVGNFVSKRFYPDSKPMRIIIETGVFTNAFTARR